MQNTMRVILLLRLQNPVNLLIDVMRILNLQHRMS